MQMKQIEAYSFTDFVEAVVNAAKAGYCLDLTKNENMPRSFVGHYQVKMFKQAEQIPALLQPKPVVQELPKEEPKETEVKPFVPSITFEVQQQQPKKRGPRPREAV